MHTAYCTRYTHYTHYTHYNLELYKAHSKPYLPPHTVYHIPHTTYHTPHTGELCICDSAQSCVFILSPCMEIIKRVDINYLSPKDVVGGVRYVICYYVIMLLCYYVIMLLCMYLLNPLYVTNAY
jgi:hypothetical protein